jgi:predicted phage tail component-like protein
MYSFTYRGLRSEDLGIEVLNVTRSIIPPNAVKSMVIPGRAGEFFIRSQYGARLFQIEVLIEKQLTLEAIEAKTEAVANFIDATLGLGELIFDDANDIKFNAIITGDTVAAQIVTYRTGTITFFVPSPYGQTIESTVTSIDGFQGTFTRATEAYSPSTGTRVLTSVPRYEPGRFNQGLTIEGGTSNLLSFTQASFEDGDAGSVGVNASVIRDIKHTWQGSLEMRVRTNGMGTDEGILSVYINVASSTTYTCSIYTLADRASTLKLVIKEYNSSNVLMATNATLGIQIPNESGSMVRIIKTFTTTSTTAKITISVLTDVVEYMTFWVDSYQLEQKAFATSFMVGGSSRADEVFTFPIRDYLRNYNLSKQGTIEFDFMRINPSTDTFSALLDWGAYSATNALDRLVIYHGTAFTNQLSRLSFQIVNGATTEINTINLDLPGPTLQNNWYYCAVRWNLPGKMNIDVFDYSTGIMYSASNTTAMAAPSFNSYQNCNLGISGGTFWVNAVFDEFRATKIYRLDAEIVAATVNNRSLTVDSDGVLKLAFDTNLSLYNTDISNVGTANVFPLIKIVTTSTATWLVVRHDNTGDLLEFDHLISTGDVFLIDNINKVVYYNGVARMDLLSISSTFFQMPKDDNCFTVGSDGTNKALIEYNANWL